MFGHRNFNRGAIRLESFEIFAEPETTCLFAHRVVSSEKLVTISVNGIDFKTNITLEEGKNPYAELENKFFDGKKIACKYTFPADVVAGPAVSINVEIQLSGSLVFVEKI